MVAPLRYSTYRAAVELALVRSRNERDFSSDANRDVRGVARPRGKRFQNRCGKREQRGLIERARREREESAPNTVIFSNTEDVQISRLGRVRPQCAAAVLRPKIA